MTVTLELSAGLCDIYTKLAPQIPCQVAAGTTVAQVLLSVGITPRLVTAAVIAGRQVALDTEIRQPVTITLLSPIAGG